VKDPTLGLSIPCTRGGLEHLERVTGLRKRKVHSLIDKVYSRVNLELAWEKVKANKGAAGVDRVTIAQYSGRKDYYLDRAPMKF
jgi:hypothetical protein